MSRRLAASLTLLCLMAASTQPVQARPAAMDTEESLGSAIVEVDTRSAWMASALSLAPGVAIYAVTAFTNQQLFNVVIPATFGAGHLYAGDPWRGALISTGGYGAAALGAALGLGVALAAPGGSGENLGKILTGGFAGIGLFGLYAAADAHWTAQRVNQQFLEDAQ